MDRQEFIVSGSILFLLPEEKKKILSELELNPGPLASQAIVLTMAPKRVFIATTHQKSLFQSATANFVQGSPNRKIAWR